MAHENIIFHYLSNSSNITAVLLSEIFIFEYITQIFQRTSKNFETVNSRQHACLIKYTMLQQRIKQIT